MSVAESESPRKDVVTVHTDRKKRRFFKAACGVLGISMEQSINGHMDQVIQSGAEVFRTFGRETQETV